MELWPTLIVLFLIFGTGVVLLAVITYVSLPRPVGIVYVFGDVVVATDKAGFEVEVDVSGILLCGGDALTAGILEDDAKVFEAVEQCPCSATRARLGTGVGVNDKIPFATTPLYGGVGAGGAGVGCCTGPFAKEYFLVVGASEDKGGRGGVELGDCAVAYCARGCNDKYGSTLGNVGKDEVKGRRNTIGIFFNDGIVPSLIFLVVASLTGNFEGISIVNDIAFNVHQYKLSIERFAFGYCSVGTRETDNNLVL